MKILNIVLIGAGVVAAYKIATYISRKNNSPVLVAGSSKPAALISVAPGTVIGSSESGADVKVMLTSASVAPSDRSIFPGNMFAKFETKAGGESTRTYMAAE